MSVQSCLKLFAILSKGHSIWWQRHLHVLLGSFTGQQEVKSSWHTQWVKAHTWSDWERRMWVWAMIDYGLLASNHVCLLQGKWKEVPAAQVSSGPAFTYAVPKVSWLTTSFNYWGRGHQPTMGRRVNSQLWAGESSTNYGYEGHQPIMGMRVINQLWVWGSSTNYG